MIAPAIPSGGRQLIGWREWAALPDLGIDIIDAKMDTGAKSSAIGVFGVKRVSVGGRPFVEFSIQTNDAAKPSHVICRAAYAGTRIIRSSNGQEEKRIIVKTRIGLGERLWKIDISLTNRDAMKFRMIIGRSALGRKFLVNPAARYLLGR